MTVVEFFDGVSIDNMVSCLTIRPDKIIFIGEKKPMKKQEEAYLRFVKNCGIDVSFDYRPIDRNSKENIVSVLIDIVESEKKCVFDLTGGEDLVLVAMGIVYEKYRETCNIQMHRFNIRTGAIYDCDCDGNLPFIEQPQLTAKANIMLYGGIIVPYDGTKGTYDWIFDEEFESDLNNMWEICKENPGLWNAQIGTLSVISERCSATAFDLNMSFNKTRTKNYMKNQKRKFVWLSGYVNELCRYGFIEDLVDEEDNVSFRYKNEQVKLCLTKEGTLLELMVFLIAKAAKNKDGMLKYNDAVTGAYINWDATIHDITDDEKDTENEIDVILMKGIVPIFISCKNGQVDETELYKLNTVAERFGGPYAQKVLVDTYFGRNNVESHKYFVQRAKDMKIQLIENVNELSNAEFAKQIKNIIC